VSANTEQESTPTKGGRTKSAILIAGVVVALLALIIVKTTAQPGSPSATEAGTATAAAGAQADADSLTSVRNDAVADYGAALKTGKPIYLLFHSLTCDPCVEISGVADRVVPAYKNKIAFVNAITDDPSGQELASKFSFQYIPTSFFLKVDGTVVDSFTGVLTDAEMKTRLDSLAAQ
jgi:thiol-disulfide isomerase/thioredoxin